MKDLIETWLHAQDLDVESQEYEDASWAVDELFNLVRDNPGKLLGIVIEILKADPSPRTIGALGAGVLEDLLVYRGSEYIDELLILARSNPNFKACLQFSYVDRGDVSDHVYEQLHAIKAHAKGSGTEPQT